MTYESLLSNSQIAELLGYELNNSLEDLPVLLEIHKFRENFETSLEEELAKAERDGILRAAEELSIYSVSNALRENRSDEKFETLTYANTEATAEQRDGNVCVTVMVQVYTGKSVFSQRSRKDARYVGDVFDRSRKINLESVDGLFLELKGHPKISALNPPIKSPSGDLLPPTHLVEAVYFGQIPDSMLPTIFERYKQMQKKT